MSNEHQREASFPACKSCNGEKGDLDTTYDRTGVWVSCSRCFGTGLAIPDKTVREAIAAYLAETPPVETELPAVKVKALEWADGAPGTYTEIAESPFGHYTVWEINGTACWSPWKQGHGSIVEGGLRGAKAAAQADYERRIISALTLKDDPGNEGDGEAEPFIPAVIVNDDAGISELVIADVPTVTGGETIVRPLFDMTTCEIVGFQWDTAAIASYRKRSEADGE